ncbi:helix-turn-helix domain-containing protein [Nonomuraea sp. NBC_01738]|uniref:PucR family transcriptional regulator n=1 Tax=Nonomuraea sp. NBC_01738 TaxID=2976003 RepID=UPI002E11CCFB|nr:helix-turn-helix domain-containing protein [Nonomuraea sp. NBC_01738]
MSEPLSLAGRAVHELLDRNAVRLARELVRGFVADIPFYRQLPDEEITGDIVRITEINLRLVARLFRERRLPTTTELAPLRASAARRAQEGVPLEAVLAAYHNGAARIWDHVLDGCGPGELDDAIGAGRLMLGYIGVVTGAVCAAYQAERESMVSQEQHARHAAITALLSGEPHATAGIRLAARYLVLSVTLGPHADERSAAVAGRRKLHRIRDAVQGFSAEPVLSLLESGGGLVLVPDLDWCEAAELVAAMGKAARVEVRAAGEVAAPEGVANAARLTQEVLDVVHLFRHPPGLYRLADVLLEYQLTRPSEAVAGLATLLDPLTDNPDLLQTLTVYLETGLDRRRTAELLHVHPNTVDYRLRRAASLTGLDPVDPAQLQSIGAALAARRVTNRPGRPPRPAS